MDGGTATYVYDGEGRRMKKTFNGETTYYFYGPGGLLCEFSTSNALSPATAASSSDKKLFRTSDKLGSAVLVINASGLVIENNRTLPYGEPWIVEDASSINEKKFTDYQRDSESGMDYAMNRYNSAAMGRFTSPDKGPMALKKPVTLNRYVYAGLDPVNHIDPDGKYAIGPGFDPYDSGFAYAVSGLFAQNLRPCEIAQMLDPIFGIFSEACGGGPGMSGPMYYQPGESQVGGGGGATPNRMSVTNFSDSGANQDKITSVLRKIESALSPGSDCAKWLQGGGVSGSDLINALLAANTYGHGDFNVGTVDAFAGQRNPDGSSAGVPVTAAFTVNNNGAFYKNSHSVGVRGYAGGTLRAQATILIHELAHILGAQGFQDDFRDPAKSRANDALVDKNCGRLIGGLR
jgi:RHS repeat-associated protein